MALYKSGQESDCRSERVQQRKSPWKHGGLTIWQLSKRVYREIDEDEVLMRAAALAFYFVSALFPMIFFLVSMLGIFAKSHDLQSSLMSYLGQFVPPDANRLIQKTLQEIAMNSSGVKLALGLGLAVWSGSGGVSSTMDALNRCYHVKDSRPWWKRKIVSLGLTIALAGLTIAALVIILYGSAIVDFIGSQLGLSALSVATWHIVQWPIALLFVVVSFALIYHWAPDVEQQWQWITPGSLVGVFAWISASLLFRVYLHYFDSYSKTYGSLGAVIVLLYWLYIGGLAILIGGEINSEIEDTTAKQGHPEGKEARKTAVEEGTRP